MKIDKNIPLPAVSGPARSKYDWLKLEVGDSFAVDGVSLRSMQSACAHSGKRHGRKYIARAVFEEKRERVRVWRFA